MPSADKPMLRGLNLGCGRKPIPSTSDQTWVNLDVAPIPEGWPDDQTYYQFDLEGIARGNSIGFPDGYFDVILASHVLEHIRGLLPLVQDLHRLLRDGGHVLVRVPYAGSTGAWEDPTHVRGFVPSTFLAFTQDYYHKADYGYRGDFTIIRSLAVVPAEYQRADRRELPLMLERLCNVGQEIICCLRAVKPIRKPSGKIPHLDTKIIFIGDPKVEEDLLKLISGR